MSRHRRPSVEFKRQIVAEYLAGESAHVLGRRHDLSRNLIRIWVEKAGAGELDQDQEAADLLGAYEARIAALERLVGAARRPRLHRLDEPLRQPLRQRQGGELHEDAEGRGRLPDRVRQLR